MLTIFGIPKRFDGHTGIIQRNAIASWTSLRPRPEIMLFGNDAGTAETCRGLGLIHVPEVACTQYGAPLLSDLFEKAQRLATQGILCYVNSDIILLSDFVEALGKVSAAHRKFLMVGRRWDVSIRESWPLDAGGNDNGLREFVIRHGKQAEPPGNSDFFAFPRGMWKSIPPLAVGRAAWDAWLIYAARCLGAEVVDASTAVMSVHQSHDQSTYPHGLRQWRNELNRNWEIAGKDAGRFCLWDATHLLTSEGLVHARGAHYFIRRVDTLHLFHPRVGALMKLPRLAIAGARSLRERRTLARNPLFRLGRLIKSRLPADGIAAILGLGIENGPEPSEKSVGLRLADSLTWAGIPVTVYDPDPSTMNRAGRSLGGPVKFAMSAAECVMDADVIVLTMPHEEFRLSSPAFSPGRNGRPCVVIDCCGVWQGDVQRPGLEYLAWAPEQ